jgi:hypothetical protein
VSLPSRHFTFSLLTGSIVFVVLGINAHLVAFNFNHVAYSVCCDPYFILLQLYKHSEFLM